MLYSGRDPEDAYLCGDEESECPDRISPMGPCVGIVANTQADIVVERLINKERNRPCSR